MKGEEQAEDPHVRAWGRLRKSGVQFQARSAEVRDRKDTESKTRTFPND